MALLVAGLLATSLALLAPVAPSAAAAQGDACPDRLIPATRFTDTTTSVHRLAIDCAAWWGLTEGRTATGFAPARDITRGQTAALVARLLRTTGQVDGTGASESSGFADTAGHRFETDIDLLAGLGIVAGIDDDHFAPDRSVSRAQMASILVATLTNAYGQSLPPGPMPFTDVSVDNVHRDAIGRLTGAGIVTGTTPTTYTPRGRVTRAQMASFTTRTATVLVDAGQATLPTARPADDDPYASRTRAAWVHLFDGTLKRRGRIAAMLDELEAAGATTVIAQVARRHDAYYLSDVLPRTPDPDVADGFDVLGELLRQAHARDIEVHAWISVAPTWHDVYRDLDAPEGWVATKHGRSAPVAHRWVTRTHDGTWSDYLDPGVPAVQAHVAAVVGELAGRYDVDAIHLDYVRYQSEQHGYNPVALERYRAETGATGTPSPTSAPFSNWRRQQTERIVVGARQAVSASGSDARLSAAVISWGAGPATTDRAGFRGTLAYTRTLQDWDRWARQGLVDAVMPMNYFRAHDTTQARWFHGWLAYERALARDVAAAVVPGIGGYLNHPAPGLAQLHAAMRASDGTVIYSYQQPTLDHSRLLLERLAATRWGYPPA